MIDPVWKLAISTALADAFGARMPPDLLNHPDLELPVQRLVIDCRAGGLGPGDLNSSADEMSPAARASWLVLLGLVRDAVGEGSARGVPRLARP
jgi:hypothetical protein